MIVALLFLNQQDDQINEQLQLFLVIFLGVNFNFFSSLWIEILNVLSSISIKSTLAPQYKAQFDEAANEIGVVHK